MNFRQASSASNKSTTGNTPLLKKITVYIWESFKLEMGQELKSLKREMADMTESTQFLSEIIDFTKIMSAFKKEMADLNKRKHN